MTIMVAIIMVAINRWENIKIYKNTSDQNYREPSKLITVMKNSNTQNYGNCKKLRNQMKLITAYWGPLKLEEETVNADGKGLSERLEKETLSKLNQRILRRACHRLSEKC